jgi:Ca2+-binding RTX toxin-like protein
MGGTGADLLTGGANADILTGGGGLDTFIFTDPGDSGNTASARDRITDFQTGIDRIDLADLFGDLGIAGAVTGGFSGVAGQVVLFSGLVMIDLDGDASADFGIEVENGGLTVTLAASDLILI